MTSQPAITASHSSGGADRMQVADTVPLRMTANADDDAGLAGQTGSLPPDEPFSSVDVDQYHAPAPAPAAESHPMLVLRSDVARDRHSRPYLRLVLRTTDGRVLDARWWRYPYPAERRPRVGQVCSVSGVPDHFHGQPQLRVLAMRPAPDVSADAFQSSTSIPADQLGAALEQRIARLTPDLGALVRAVLSEEVGTRSRTWPASHTRHGAVRHGLLDHSLRVATIAEQLASAYQGQATLVFDVDLVSAACLLHDVGKVYTLPEVPGTPLPAAASVADHVTRSALLVQAAAAHLPAETRVTPERLGALLHTILAHHGRREWGAPVEPKTLEAWLVHLADYAESRLWRWLAQSADVPRRP